MNIQEVVSARDTGRFELCNDDFEPSRAKGCTQSPPFLPFIGVHRLLRLAEGVLTEGLTQPLPPRGHALLLWGHVIGEACH